MIRYSHKRSMLVATDYQFLDNNEVASLIIQENEN